MAHTQIIPRRIRIINALSGPGITGRKSAKDYVRRGLAVWIGVSAIEMLECRQRTSARLTLDYTGYDRAVTTGLAQDRAMVNVPITRPDIALQRGQRSYGCGPLHRH